MPRTKLPFRIPNHWPADLRAAIAAAAQAANTELVDPTEMSVELIKQFCKTLLDHNITSVHGSYDGSGDSGDMSITLTQFKTEPAKPGREARVTEVILRDDRAREAIVTAGIVSQKLYDDFIDALWNLLPGGWEINDGSYGEITVDTRTEKINVEHNERYTDVNTSNYNY